MYLKLILSIVLVSYLSACDGSENVLLQKWSQNNDVKCTDSGNYIDFTVHGVVYSNAVVEAMIFDKPDYRVDEKGDLLIYPNFEIGGKITYPVANRDFHLKMVRNEDTLSFENYYLGEEVVTNTLDENLLNTAKLLDLVRCP